MNRPRRRALLEQLGPCLHESTPGRGPAARPADEAAQVLLPVSTLRHAQPLRVLISWVSCGDDVEEVADDAVVDEVEDGGFGVLVDRDDGLGGLHAGPVLDGAGDAVGDVQLRRDGLAGLADLVGVRVPARVDRGAGGADGGAEGVGQVLDEAKFSAPLTPRPPETTIAASVSSGGRSTRAGCGR